MPKAHSQAFSKGTSVIARRCAKSETAFCIFSLLVKRMAKWSFVAIIITTLRRPMSTDSATVTKTENLAARGWPDPSSFDTRTLEGIHEEMKQKNTKWCHVIQEDNRLPLHLLTRWTAPRGATPVRLSLAYNEVLVLPIPR